LQWVSIFPSISSFPNLKLPQLRLNALRDTFQGS
jgi:hypothetical protein